VLQLPAELVGVQVSKVRSSARSLRTWTGASDSFFNVKSAGEGKGGTDKKVDEKKLAQNRYVEVELSYLQ
jgi:hypothetical protein